MLDIKEIRKNPSLFEKKLQTKGVSLSIDSLLSLDEELRCKKTEVEELKAQKNEASRQVALHKNDPHLLEKTKETVAKIGHTIATLDDQIRSLEENLHQELSLLPNIPMDDIPISDSAKDNVCIKEWGKKPHFSFPFKNHVELNETLQFFDFTRGVKIAGSGFPLYKGKGAQIEWALLHYMLSIHRKNGFTQIIPPLLANPSTMYGSAHLPKFEEQLFRLQDKDHSLYLIPTAESALNGMHAGEILPEEELPLYYTAYTPCFRREAGAAGSQERGLIRTHQFQKVEMFCFTTPSNSEATFQKMLDSAEEILQGLQIHYRNMLLTTGDMSFAAAKTVDIEVWLPGQNRYYEVSSVSNCTDFQARRSQIRYKGKEGKPQFVHTLNGSGLATSRLMVALLENSQKADGSIEIPAVLRPWM